jgi:hypothetical protein
MLGAGNYLDEFFELFFARRSSGWLGRLSGGIRQNEVSAS